ncbi:MAG: tRNA (guanosine(46)-N7)-methyltransferase TrmB [Lachnospiraceae bacterium]|nr:tRNA (guanosine(46)-N7)-methyltransferase TrmB [Lachnospiraceae bacterium]
MRLRNIPGAREIIENSPLVIKEAEKTKGLWKELFGNDNPIHIEVGMGKGRFLMTMAEKNPDVNYIGIERYTSVLLRALQKMEEKPLPNLVFLCMDAAELEQVFETEEVEKIYLNFSDPWPKDRHARRRLPSREFLARYDKILAQGGRLEFKTDNRALFDFAVEELEPAGWKAEKITYDLHADAEMMKDNVMTEYEERFSSVGNPICKYVIYR